MLDTKLLNEYREVNEHCLLDISISYKKALEKLRLFNKTESYLDAEFLLNDAEDYAKLAETVMKELKENLKFLQEEMSIKVRKAKEELELKEVDEDEDEYVDEDEDEE